MNVCNNGNRNVFLIWFWFCLNHRGATSCDNFTPISNKYSKSHQESDLNANACLEIFIIFFLNFRRNWVQFDSISCFINKLKTTNSRPARFTLFYQFLTFLLFWDEIKRLNRKNVKLEILCISNERCDNNKHFIYFVVAQVTSSSFWFDNSKIASHTRPKTLK